MPARAQQAGSRIQAGARPQREAGGLCAEMAAAAAAAAEEGMEPRALQYEQTLVSEAEQSPEGCARDCCSWLPLEARGEEGLS